MSIKSFAKKAAVGTTKSVCGSAYFTFDSLATITATVEANIVHSLTGEDKFEVWKQRSQKCVYQQERIQMKAEVVKRMFSKNKFETKTETA